MAASRASSLAFEVDKGTCTWGVVAPSMGTYTTEAVAGTLDRASIIALVNCD